ncbi:MAG: elongation factor G [Peptostreptococcaceae bacterium]|jgi:elongation factor G|nr:elongation factor G [Peptostreptococcaceae bacterium]
MRVYETNKIRNMVVLGHSGCGKTNLMEAILYTNDKAKKISQPNDNSTMSTSLDLYPIEWSDHKYNFIDTPGYYDFSSEVKSALKGAAGSIIVVDGTSDLAVGTDLSLEMTDEENIPKLIFVNKIDSEKANYQKVVEQLRQRYGKKIAPFHVPMGKDKDFKGFVNVVDLFAREYNGNNCVTIDIPDYMNNEIKDIREMLLESVAESDEKLLDKYFEGIEFSKDEIHTGLRKGVLSGDIIPVLCGSTAKNIGIHTLLDMIWDYMPSPMDAGYEHKDDKFSGFVFKTKIDSFIGRISYVKVIEGEIKKDQEIYNVNTRTKEKVSHIYTMEGSKQIEIDKAIAGDIIVLTKLSDAQTNHTLSISSSHEEFNKIDFPKPQLYLALKTKDKGDEDKISTALHRAMEEDPSISKYRSRETKQTLIGGQGEMHINQIRDLLKSKYNVEVELEEPKVAYRETIKSKSDVQGRHKKQSGGHGQFGDVKIRFEPCNEDFVFEEEIFGGSIPKGYIPAVEKGLKDSMENGILAGYPVSNIKAILYDGSYHDVDSSEMAFKMAASNAFKKGMEEGKATLLEPIMKLKIIVPEDYMGDIMGDINKRRGRILGMEPVKNTKKQMILAEAPQAETFRYSMDLRSMTQGRGKFEIDFERYEEVPEHLIQKILNLVNA